MIATEPEAWDVLTDLLASCVDDPARFAHVFLAKYGRPWSRQEEICRSVAKFRTTVVYSGNMIGKSWTTAILMIWWLLTRPDALVVVTGASQQTVGSIVWKELRRALDSAALPFGGRLSQGIKASPAFAEVALGWGALGFATTGVERASGQHARHLLVIVDEASGLDEAIWEALDSLGASRLLAIGNPIRSTGVFVDLIRQADRDRADGIPPERAVNAIRIPSTESPHAHLDRSPVGLADRTWIEAMRRKYGPDSLWCRSHIDAEIPGRDGEQLIPLSWLDPLIAQGPAPILPGWFPVRETRRIACDLSEGVGRDSTCILVRDDHGVLDALMGSAWGLPEAAARIAELARKWEVPDHRITYDVLGIGRTMQPHLLGNGIAHAQPYAGAGSPRSKACFANLRSEAGWNLRCRLDPEHRPLDAAGRPIIRPPFRFAAGPYLERLREDLKPLTYELAGTQVKLLNMADHAAALGRSPDAFDALCQSFAFI
jgi:hypothetical protein